MKAKDIIGWFAEFRGCTHGPDFPPVFAAAEEQEAYVQALWAGNRNREPRTRCAPSTRRNFHVHGKRSNVNTASRTRAKRKRHQNMNHGGRTEARLQKGNARR